MGKGKVEQESEDVVVGEGGNPEREPQAPQNIYDTGSKIWQDEEAGKCIGKQGKDRKGEEKGNHPSPPTPKNPTGQCLFAGQVSEGKRIPRVFARQVSRLMGTERHLPLRQVSRWQEKRETTFLSGR